MFEKLREILTPPPLPKVFTEKSIRNYFLQRFAPYNKETPRIIHSKKDCITTFNWRDYIEFHRVESVDLSPNEKTIISIEAHESFEREMSKVLDKLSTIPNIQMYMVQNKNLHGEKGKLKLSIGAESHFSPITNTIDINPYTLSYPFSNKVLYPQQEPLLFDAYDVMTHELYHAADRRLFIILDAYTEIQNKITEEINDPRKRSQAIKVLDMVNSNINQQYIEGAASNAEKQVDALKGTLERHKFEFAQNIELDIGNPMNPKFFEISPSAANANWGCGVKSPGK